MYLYFYFLKLDKSWHVSSSLREIYNKFGNHYQQLINECIANGNKQYLSNNPNVIQNKH